MFHSSDHRNLGHACIHLYAARYLDEGEDGAYPYHEPAGSDVATKTPNAGRDVDEVGNAVVPRTIPNFWKPVEDWMLD